MFRAFSDDRNEDINQSGLNSMSNHFHDSSVDLPGVAKGILRCLICFNLSIV